MSNRNSQEAKRAARERLRAEREKQAKKEKVRRQAVVGGSIVAVLAVAAGIGVAVSKMGGPDGPWAAAAQVADKGADGSMQFDGKTVAYHAPAHTSGKKGLNVVVGDKNAKHTLTLYEDMRCPICSQFEQNVGETIQQDIKDGKYKVKFVFGTFLDGDTADGLGSRGTGSKNALSALGAALDVSPQAFVDYKYALFSKKNHPEETVDAFAKDKKLIDVAQQVDALKDNKEFQKAVKDGRYDAWAMAMSAKFRAAKDVSGTPTVKLDGVHLKADASGSPPMTPQQFNQLVDQQMKKK
ncbi:MAG TPA: thioredoxin domain-containing protein [Streptomyces sp.]|nr:thioredoxin domain-containing protein [Streptomyces sp.]